MRSLETDLFLLNIYLHHKKENKKLWQKEIEKEVTQHTDVHTSDTILHITVNNTLFSHSSLTSESAWPTHRITVEFKLGRYRFILFAI